MTEHPITVDAREAKGLHDGSITRIVRVCDLPRDRTWPTLMWFHRDIARFSRTILDWFETADAKCPFGVPGDRLRAVCEPGEPCEHRGCLSHVTHVCEGCGRGHAGILLDVTDVRLIRVQEITEEDALRAGVCDVCDHDGVLHPQTETDPAEMCGGRGGMGCAEDGHAKSLCRALIGPDTWDANKWVWLGTVARVEDVA